MSLTGGAKFILTGGANYQIARSLRFRSSNSAYLTRTFGAPTTQNTFTWSGWVKRSGLGTLTNLFGVSTNNSIGFPAANTLVVTLAGVATITTSALYRDPSAWAHVLYQQTTGAAYLYFNGTQVGTSATVSAVFNTAVAHQIGAANTSNYFNGYLAEVNFIDGQTLGPSYFGKTDATTGAWNPIKYIGTYGTNGFYLPFSDNSAATSTTIGKDSSGNGNNWTPSGISVTAGATNDSLVDVPTNYGSDTGAGGEVRGNYATMNPLDLGPGSLSEGNLAATMNVSASIVRGTFGMSSGKWYFEYLCSSSGDRGPGIATSAAGKTTAIGSDTFGWCYLASGNKLNNASSVAYGATYTTNDVIGVAFDADAGTLTFYKNGASQGSAYTGLTSGPYFAATGASASSTNGHFNFGQRPFANAAPTGFKALCTQNLPDPAIPKPSLFMDVNTRTGTGAAFSVTGKSFQPDLVWMKGRSGATSHAIYDAVRTATKDLGSNLATDETTQAQGLTAFNSDGFSGGTLAKINTSAATYVDWMWKKGVTPGIDVVSYTGNGANRTIAHTLGVVPSMMIVKSRVTAGADTGWAVYHSALANTEYLKLNSIAAKATGATYWNSTAPNSSVFSLGTAADTNTNLDTYINYLFAEVSGFSKFGSYTGNGSTDGPFVWCGFRPRYVLLKRSSSASVTYAWQIYDTARSPSNQSLLPGLWTDASESEFTNQYGLDIISNGFKLRDAGENSNASTNTYIFAAFAEAPFKTARAR